jgi:GTP pyrophosphokinase
MGLTIRFRDAFDYAFELHELRGRQRRKRSEVPYVAHLLGVAALVLEHGGDEDQAIAALLHDAVEDQGGRAVLEEIRRRFGEEVARIVADCTDADEEPKPPWRPRKEQFLASLPAMSGRSLLVVAADKLHNARAILGDHRLLGDALYDRFRGGKDGTLWYYRAITDHLLESGPRALALELDRVVAALEAAGTRGTGRGKT